MNQWEAKKLEKCRSFECIFPTLFSTSSEVALEISFVASDPTVLWTQSLWLGIPCISLCKAMCKTIQTYAITWAFTPVIQRCLRAPDTGVERAWEVKENVTWVAPEDNCLKMCMCSFSLVFFCFAFYSFPAPVHSLERVVVSNYRGTVHRLCRRR